jgi:hypothetical protein
MDKNQKLQHNVGGTHGLAGWANPEFIFFIAPCGEMASFPIGIKE